MWTARKCSCKRLSSRSENTRFRVIARVGNLPLGIILCAGKNTEQIELLELDAAGIHVAEYLSVLPVADLQREKLQKVIETARAPIEPGCDDRETEDRGRYHHR